MTREKKFRENEESVVNPQKATSASDKGVKTVDLEEANRETWVPRRSTHQRTINRRFTDYILGPNPVEEGNGLREDC